MLLSDFDYALPPEAIATEPARPRDAARLLQVGPTGLTDGRIRDLPDLLRAGDCLVVNDTKVIPAQLTATRGNATIGITLDRPMPDGTWRVLLRNARRARVGEQLTITGAPDFTATIIVRDDDGSAALRFNRSGADFDAALAAAGALALPPYIARPTGPTAQDASDYQTIFADRAGAVAAPTAGLHFTPALLDALAAKSISTARVTLHVGAGTFLPVRGESIDGHKIHAEYGEISAAAAARINQARAAGGRIIAVGTTSLRLLESAVTPERQITAFAGETDIFLHPGVTMQAADMLLTNFHLPRSTLLMLVAGFAGLDRIRSAYEHAIANGYRFYSYGDACLLERG
ncbi:MAG TPA: tRNA preQ1(34) S-adenosylmethionine ribosyltransferase-isomerase QueA [Acidiphilium sp.]|nr:MAG: tRNA preQ1(34) S-adenosylmethionine ribosyltransferase-isomerase QueA [Acidiphilium sp. 21-60-14]OYV91062.1 MAG: tRNA preQ1(34) S-adenosylmethionine ribosyltransferase-isomerase QueA [Acidiphilium sp. 37-60-79]OZB40173.1 MAG: tRNA preQ1(34) S-adenosylmethionine ribosyltransferase-isomerase QueA [Acidiphilium sp. 34-60-192]HQT87835.1 tRNA preQ1(34) S-adenosylmethionine ribosyltransferase-isomerase QueA [Acidiphilium sp.]HQU23776.1 tRNA preQ1(34) S-adenosylmethionine ribosyltransferase-is